MTNDPGAVECDTCEPCDTASEQSEDDFLAKIDEIDEDYIADPEGIAVPWEEKYDKKEEEINAVKGASTVQAQSVPEKTVAAAPTESTQPIQIDKSAQEAVAEPVPTKIQNPTEEKEQKEIANFLNKKDV